MLFSFNPTDYHWSLIVIQIEHRIIRHYCSLGTKLNDYSKSEKIISMMKSVINEHIIYKGEWKTIENKNAPIQ